LRRLNRYLIVFIILGGMFLPFIPTAKAETEKLRFSIGTWSAGQDWDPISYGGLNLLDTYMQSALEPLVLTDKNFAGQNDQYTPTLAMSWEIEFWPEENNSKGFFNRDGIKSIEFTLREGVIFHDGSHWNAEVAKWNIDRIMVGNGNLTGSGLKKWKHAFYVEASEYMDYFTPSWNLTSFNNTYPVYGGYTDCDDPSMFSYVPVINDCVITEDKPTGGKINITSNHWNAGLLGLIGGQNMLSMESYEDFFDTPILGYGNNPTFPQPSTSQMEAGNYPASGFPGHMIGTGPFRFITHDEAASPAGGYMKKFEPYWNNTALSAYNLSVVDYYDVVYFPYDAAGNAVRNTAIVTGELDITFHTATGPLNYDDVANSTVVDWVDTTYDPNMNIIVFNCIDDWSIPNATLYDYGVDKSVRKGVPRAFRKALSYAFDYDTFITVAKQDRAVRLIGPVGRSSTYFNASLPHATFDLNISRQALIDGGIAPAYTAGWTNAQWINRSSADPFYVWDYAWDDAHQLVNNEVLNAIQRIGCATNSSPEWKFDPYCFAHIYESMFLGGTTWPFYTNGGFNMKWPMPDTGTIGNMQAYFGSSEPWNLGFSYNSTTDEWLDQMSFSGPATIQQLHDQYITWQNTEQFAWLPISQDKNGYAINKEFEYDWLYIDDNYLPARVKYFGTLAEITPRAAIPGYSITTMTLVMLGIGFFIYFRMKRKRTTE
jgi:ABC-type transport system substrate-binding protein